MSPTLPHPKKRRKKGAGEGTINSPPPTNGNKKWLGGWTIYSPPSSAPKKE